MYPRIKQDIFTAVRKARTSPAAAPAVAQSIWMPDVGGVVPVGEVAGDVEGTGSVQDSRIETATRCSSAGSKKV